MVANLAVDLRSAPFFSIVLSGRKAKIMQRVLENKTDFIVTVLILSFATGALTIALEFPAGSRVWPVAILSMLIVCTGIYLAIFFLGANPKRTDEEASADMDGAPEFAGNSLKIAFNIALITALIFAVSTAGLYVSTGLYLFSHMIFLGIRPLWLAFACALGGTAVIYVFSGLRSASPFPMSRFSRNTPCRRNYSTAS